MLGFGSMLLFFGTNQKGAYDRELQMCCMHVYVIFNILLHFFYHLEYLQENVV